MLNACIVKKKNQPSRIFSLEDEVRTNIWVLSGSVVPDCARRIWRNAWNRSSILLHDSINNCNESPESQFVPKLALSYHSIPVHQ